MISDLTKIKDIRQNKMTMIMEKSRSAAAASHAPHPEAVHHDEVHPAHGKLPSFATPILMVAVIALGILFVAINYRVLAELQTVRSSMGVLMRKTGMQNGKVGSIERSIQQAHEDNKKLKSDLIHQQAVMTTMIEKIQYNVNDNGISDGILRSKLSELTVAQRKLLDEYNKLNNEVQILRQVQTAPAQ